MGAEVGHGAHHEWAVRPVVLQVAAVNEPRSLVCSLGVLGFRAWCLGVQIHHTGVPRSMNGGLHDKTTLPDTKLIPGQLRDTRLTSAFPHARIDGKLRRTPGPPGLTCASKSCTLRILRRRRPLCQEASMHASVPISLKRRRAQCRGCVHLCTSVLKLFTTLR